MSPTYTSVAGISAAKHPPATVRATPRTSRFGASAEATPASPAPSSDRRMTRTRPMRSLTIPHTGCISP